MSADGDREETRNYAAGAIAQELAKAPQDKDPRDVRSQHKVCSGEQQGAAQTLALRGVFATAGTGLFARPFHLETLLRDGVLPPIDGGERIHRIGHANGPIRVRYHLAEADGRRRDGAVRQRVG